MSDDDHRDLSDDNLLPILLQEREQLKSLTDNAERRLKEINAEIKHRLRGARSARLPGWSIDYVTFQRRQYTVPKQEIGMLYIKRVSEE